MTLEDLRKVMVELPEGRRKNCLQRLFNGERVDIYEYKNAPMAKRRVRRSPSYFRGQVRRWVKKCPELILEGQIVFIKKREIPKSFLRAV